jgi:ABC-2 type transport system permease protein
MSMKRSNATTLRVLKQLRHDHRTLALILFMPSVLLVVLKYVFNDSHALFNATAPLLLGIIPFTMMFIISSVAILRERVSGTLERLLTMPIAKLDLIAGYATAFGFLALVQASIASFVALVVLDVSMAGSPIFLLGNAMLAGILGMSFGLLFSAFAHNEFQAVQFMPAFVLPQFLTCGLFVPRDQMASGIQYFSDIMPLTYIVKAVSEAVHSQTWTTVLTTNIAMITGFIVFALILGALSLRRR